VKAILRQYKPVYYFIMLKVAENVTTCLQVQEPMIFYFLLPFLLGFVPTKKHSRANRWTFYAEDKSSRKYQVVDSYYLCS